MEITDIRIGQRLAEGRVVMEISTTAVGTLVRVAEQGPTGLWDMEWYTLGQLTFMETWDLDTYQDRVYTDGSEYGSRQRRPVMSKAWAVVVVVVMAAMIALSTVAVVLAAQGADTQGTGTTTTQVVRECVEDEVVMATSLGVACVHIDEVGMAYEVVTGTTVDGTEGIDTERD